MRHTCASPSNGALDKLVTTHGALVLAIAVNIHSKLPVHVELCDLVQEGMRGLIDAARRYDPSRGVPFTMYAKYRVRGAILDGLRRFDPASRAFRTTSKKLDAAAHELADELGRTPTESEVAARAAVDLTRESRIPKELLSLAFQADGAGQNARIHVRFIPPSYSMTEEFGARRRGPDHEAPAVLGNSGACVQSDGLAAE